jgi:hypothetical protein
MELQLLLLNVPEKETSLALLAMVSPASPLDTFPALVLL